MSSTYSRTALLEAPRQFALVDRPIPVAGPTEGVVRVAATAEYEANPGRVLRIVISN